MCHKRKVVELCLDRFLELNGEQFRKIDCVGVQNKVIRHKVIECLLTLVKLLGAQWLIQDFSVFHDCLDVSEHRLYVTEVLGFPDHFLGRLVIPHYLVAPSHLSCIFQIVNQDSIVELGEAS